MRGQARRDLGDRTAEDVDQAGDDLHPGKGLAVGSLYGHGARRRLGQEEPVRRIEERAATEGRPLPISKEKASAAEHRSSSPGTSRPGHGQMELALAIRRRARENGLGVIEIVNVDHHRRARGRLSAGVDDAALDLGIRCLCTK